jgi:hypothetical protein
LRLAGLNIEAETIRAAIINRIPGRTVLVKTTAFELNDVEGKGKAEAFASILEHLRDKEGVRGVVVGIGMTSFTHHFINLPLVKRPDIIHALGFELEKHLPLPPDEYLYDFVTVSRTDEGSNLMVLAALRNKHQWISSACDAAGLVLIGIRCTPMEAMNEFASENEADGILLAYMGHDATILFGMKNTAPVELKVLRKETTADADIKAFTEKYDRGSFSAREPEGDYIDHMDATALDYDIPQILTRSAFRKRRFDMQFATGTGRSAIPLWHEQAPAVLGALCILFFLLTSIVSYYKDSSALRHISSELERIEQQSEGLMGVREEIESIKARKMYINELRTRRSLRILAVRELSIRLPSSAWLTSLSIDEEGNVQIQGHASRASDIIRPLDASGLFRNVEFSSPVTIQAGRERFSISMEMEQ